ncbi:aminotransferase class I/II-fold pyridoxal phosphate-dependent enzyme [Lentzea sp. NPDC004782]|uniref:pyridoxal phosphate-dependent decarboxylase family protein n=1 Tax=Lentzea sp. NPDC004782 TaxID=3154458 RepID=UPI0033BC56CE
MDLQRWAAEAVRAVNAWAATHGTVDEHPSMTVDDDRFAAAFHEFTHRLGDNYPFFHPSYAGHMMRAPHPAAAVGHLAAMLINPNNHSFEGGPATGRMEQESVAQLAAMFGFDTHLGHLTSSGTIANLEALYIARELSPGKTILFSEEAHFTHSRMCRVLGVQSQTVPVDSHGRMDVDALERRMRTGQVGTVVATAGTTGLGAVDPVHDILEVAQRYGARVHVDAAYGGFYTLLAGASGPAGLAPEPWQAIARCDSVVIDPHKHGLQPYGCGAVLFREPSVSRFYVHDSPYTYCTPAALHLGEISLECSKSGAAAAALWLTLRLLPATRDGLGKVLAACRTAAVSWASLIESSALLRLYQQPELDIVTWLPVTGETTMSGVDAAVEKVFAEARNAAHPVYLSTFKATRAAFAARHPDLGGDLAEARVVRSVLMKPEFEHYVTDLHMRVEALVRAVGAAGP